MSSGRALYYPSIDFRSSAWLKEALLYWDRVDRICPEERLTRQRDCDLVLLGGRQAIVGHMSGGVPDPKITRLLELDPDLLDQPLTSALNPRDLDDGKVVDAVSDAFLDLLAQHGPALRDRYAVGRVDGAPAVQGRLPGAVVWVLGWKMAFGLACALLDLGLGVAETADNPESPIAMHEELASVYITALAMRCAPAWGAHLLAERPLHAIAGSSSFRLGQLAHALLPDIAGAAPARDPLDAAPSLASADVTRAFAAFAFRSVGIEDAGSVPAESLIRFHRAHAAQRLEFRAAVQEIVEELGYLTKVSDAALFQSGIEERWKATLGPRLERLEADLRRMGARTKWSATGYVADLGGAGALLAAGMAPLVAAPGDLPSALLAAGATGVAALAFWSARRDTAGEKESRAGELAAESYLLAMRRELGQPSMSEVANELARHGCRPWAGV